MKSLSLIRSAWMTQIMIDLMDEFQNDEYIFIDKVFTVQFVVSRIWRLKGAHSG